MSILGRFASKRSYLKTSQSVSLVNDVLLCFVVDRDNSQWRDERRLLLLLRNARIRLCTLAPDGLLKPYIRSRGWNGKSGISIILWRVVPHATRCASLLIDINGGEMFLGFKISGSFAQHDVTKWYLTHAYFAIATPAGPTQECWQVLEVYCCQRLPPPMTATRFIFCSVVILRTLLHTRIIDRSKIAYQ